jgi:hypothetical protein
MFENRNMANNSQDFAKQEKKFKEPPSVEKSLYHMSWEFKSITARLLEINETLKQLIALANKNSPF